jgi:hypothetical protein
MNRRIEIRSRLNKTIETYKGTEEVSVSLIKEASDNIAPEYPICKDEECKDSFAYLSKFTEEKDCNIIQDQRVDEDIVLRSHLAYLMIITEH